MKNTIGIITSGIYVDDLHSGSIFEKSLGHMVPVVLKGIIINGIEKVKKKNIFAYTVNLGNVKSTIKNLELACYVKKVGSNGFRNEYFLTDRKPWIPK